MSLVLARKGLGRTPDKSQAVARAPSKCRKARMDCTGCNMGCKARTGYKAHTGYKVHTGYKDRTGCKGYNMDCTGYKAHMDCTDCKDHTGYKARTGYNMDCMGRMGCRERMGYKGYMGYKGRMVEGSRGCSSKAARTEAPGLLSMLPEEIEKPMLSYAPSRQPLMPPSGLLSMPWRAKKI